MKRAILSIVTGLIFSLGFAQAQENQEYDKWQIRLRGVGVVPVENAEISTIGGNVSVSSTFIPELDITYFFSKNVAAELILGTTKHNVHTTNSDLSAIGGAANANVDLGDVWLLPPTLTLQYHFRPNKVWKPYVGAGVNYTIFYNPDAGNTVKDISYDNTFGFAMQLGTDINISKNIFLNLDVKNILLKTDVNVDASNLAAGLHIPAKVDINPFLLGFGVGIKF
ncbi:OmpW/AlkL family protein [Sphingobacterium sp. T2]|uniref:OmpW/AlkL family protein n=1 Tax=Sphingobacterium sp. T2 TaxID=1590596 RepID=UPI00057BC180|nr:OmpW family outer membrane protein [Sphingobacterium sp. T2]